MFHNSYDTSANLAWNHFGSNPPGEVREGWPSRMTRSAIKAGSPAGGVAEVKDTVEKLVGRIAPERSAKSVLTTGNI
jgi:hypothetical protein